MAMNQIERIREKLNAKGVRINPPATEESVVAFETRYGIKLPRGYRNYLTHIANGGIGPPSYGLLPITDIEATGKTQAEVLNILKTKGVLLTTERYSSIRAVMHLDVSMDEVKQAASVFQSLFS